MNKPRILFLSCEHAVNTVPVAYRAYFNGHNELLNTHRGIDFGALTIAKHLSSVFHCELIQAHATRLLIDCNRKLSNPHCFSEITQPLSKTVRQAIIQEYYLPYREKVIAAIDAYIKKGMQVWHLSIHSFTPIFNNLVRNADIGLLYDPRRSNERFLAKHWQLQLKQQNSELRVRMNYPYRGITDGFTSYLRKKFDNDQYLGLEVENNQAIVKDEKLTLSLAKTLAKTLQPILLSRSDI